MASLFKKPRSPFWHLRFKGPDGKWKKSSTGLRVDDPKETLQARQIRAKAEGKELGDRPKATAGWDWVDPFFIQTTESEKSLVRYRNCWEWILVWLTTNKLTPEKIRYSHAQEYLEWRSTQRRRKRNKLPARNTILLELRVFTGVLTQAVRKHIIPGNPFFRLKLAKGKTKKKPEITDEEFTKIEKALKKEPQWMQDCWLISRYTGCRLSETRIRLTDIDLAAELPTITFATPKGGEDKAFSDIIPTALMTRFRAMKDAGQEWTLDLPFQPSRRWQQFFQKIKLSHITFHCLRVTKATRMRRQGVPLEVAKRKINHSSDLMHQVYVRHRVQDLVDYRDAGN